MKFKDSLEGLQEKKFFRSVAAQFDPENNEIDKALLKEIMSLDFTEK